MRIRVFETELALANEAAGQAAHLIRHSIRKRGRARILVATGTSQIQFLNVLTSLDGVDWANVEMFHLDEYVGIGLDHPASFRKYLLDRFVSKTQVGFYHLLDGEADPEVVCREIGRQLTSSSVDVAFAGIGENGHLAFNDPPADFLTEAPFQLVNLNEDCRRQQVGEGWFNDFTQVPERAISISIRQLLKAKSIISVVPGARKAKAVERCLNAPISPLAPASALRTHPDTTLYLDREAAALFDSKLREQC